MNSQEGKLYLHEIKGETYSLFSNRMIQIQGKNDQIELCFGGKLIKSLLIVHFHVSFIYGLMGP